MLLQARLHAPHALHETKPLPEQKTRSTTAYCWCRLLFPLLKCCFQPACVLQVLSLKHIYSLLRPQAAVLTIKTACVAGVIDEHLHDEPG